MGVDAAVGEAIRIPLMTLDGVGRQHLLQLIRPRVGGRVVIR
jgi:hypothetical protein